MKSTTREATMIRSVATAIVLLSAGTFTTPPTLAAEDAPNTQLGTVHFDTSCNEQAQRRFDRAMRFQHSFWYSAAKDEFEDTLKLDPGCAIAYWGIGLTLLTNPFNPPTPPNLALGLAALQKAKAIGAKTPRENDFIDALLTFYTDYDKVDHRTRVLAYLKAMEGVAARNPDDETQIFYALALDVGASPADKTYANQLKAAAILEPIFLRQPQHPGVAHYLIHTYDYPPIAQKGLDAAERYSKIAPSAPHAQHMPSHIFTRVGYWKDSVNSNLASVRAAKASKEGQDQLHGMDYLVYAYLQLGQDDKAKTVIDDMGSATIGPDSFAGQYALAASPARYIVERGDWAGAAKLEVRPTKFAHVEAITRFARALGATRSGNPDAAKDDIAQLATLRDKLRDAKDAYWSQQVDIQWQTASAWLLLAQGHADDALKAMNAAADTEDKTEKSPVTPGPLAPARELLGDMLLDRGMAKEALAAYEATLAKEPGRLRATIGAAKAAAKAGDDAKAKDYIAKIAALGDTATRGEIAEARATGK
jgi:hypothetical protein